MSAQELRQKYLDFFKSKGHQVVDSASLIPENDPTVLFTTAGMHPLVPYLMGQAHPAGKRLVSVQKCLRTGDIDEVGDLTHLTFFEMLGNWSLGDYFKPEAIAWSYEFLTSPAWLKLDKSRLAVSVFAGDNDAPFDQEAYDLWLGLGFLSGRIAKLAKEDNWWGPAGQSGPCGPDTEIFYWTGIGLAPEKFDPTDKRWVEIWNNVFMAYNKNADGSFSELKQKNVDTGMGLERTWAVLNGVSDIYQSEFFAGALAWLTEASGKSYETETRSLRIILDHIRSAVMIMGDHKGVAPGNVDQAYVVRKLIRRAVRYAKQLGVPENLSVTTELAKIFIANLGEVYPEIKNKQAFIIGEMAKEEDKFEATLERGLKEFARLSGNISGQQAFDLYQSYGFPLEMTEELAREKGLTVDSAAFNLALTEHQDLSRTAAAGRFKGGLADHGAEVTQLHTATHLLLAALKKVAGDHIHQRGSNITAERLRLDFSHPDKLTLQQIAQVEQLVNEAIGAKLPVTCLEMTVAEAKALGAEGVFESKYGEKVNVYTVGDGKAPFSREICGGPHVANTGEMGHFKILKEEASSAGIRRIKAVLE